MGNLYRFLRVLEEDGIVSSEWDDDAPGPSKRIYELTDEGRALLDHWASALEDSQNRVGGFLTRYGERR
jgi:PadR family transcriptional regulator, regulatory protein PadR